MTKDLDKWITAQKKYRLSDMHIQMARELGLNSDKFGQKNAISPKSFRSQVLKL